MRMGTQQQQHYQLSYTEDGGTSLPSKMSYIPALQRKQNDLRVLLISNYK